MARRQFVPKASYDAARQLQNGTYSGQAGDLLAHTLFDTAVFQVGAKTQQSTKLFTVPQGQSTPGWGTTAYTKDATWTNMTDSGKLPAGQKFLARAIRFDLVIPTIALHSSAALQAFYRVMQSSRFRIAVAGREFDWECPGSMFLPAVPMVVDTATAGRTINNGVYFGAPKIGLETAIALTDANGAPVNFSLEHYIATSDAGMTAALDTLGGTAAATEFRLRANLLGNLVRLK